MPTCEKCSEQVHKVSTHSITKKSMCLKCLIETGSYQPRLEELEPGNEKRGSIRIPLTLVMDIELENDKNRYPAHSADMSMTGICFGWEGCHSCKGYVEQGIDENCIFYPYDISNEDRKTFIIELSISNELSIQVPAYAVYTLKEESLNIEYVGAKFTDLTPEENRAIEEVIIKYAKTTE